MIATVWKEPATPKPAEWQPTIFIVDDDPDVRRTIALLARSVDLATEQFNNGKEFLEHFSPVRPGCLVLDMRMPGMSGLELQKELAERDSCLPIIFITAHGGVSNATAAMRAGAIDFLRKPYDPQTLLERIHEAIAVNRQQLQQLRERIEVQTRIDTLTEREREIMLLLSQGDSTKSIAARLSISTKTVDNHRGKVLEKMDVDNTTQLSRLAAIIN